MLRAILLLPLAVCVLAAQSGTKPKASAPEYPAHGTADGVEIGAEYLVHSFSAGRDMYIAKDYLVVEVALFPPKGGQVTPSALQFRLRINGRKEALNPQAPGVVAEALKYPDPDMSTGLHPVGQVGPVVFGAPRPVERFPGDPNGQDPRMPKPPNDQSGSLDKPKPVSPEDLVIETALPEDQRREPVSGFLYFPYKGKISRIHSLELDYHNGSGSLTLRLPL